MNKKALGPVVAMALLLGVAVVGVVSFQSWFGQYSSTVFGDVETRSTTTSGTTQIETVVGENLYFRNGATQNLSIQQIKINGEDCSISQNVSQGVSEIDISSCLSNITKNTLETVVITNSGIFTEYIFLEQIPTNTCTNTTVEGFASGSGTIGDPWEICDCTMLQAISSHLTSHFILNSHIDCSSTSSWNSGEGFTPIDLFRGTFNGANYNINNLYINETDSSDQFTGLFGFFDTGNTANLTNINLVNARVESNRTLGYVGGLVGYSNGNIIISNAFVSGSIINRGTNSGAGCIVGYNNGGVLNISNSHSSCIMSAPLVDHVGGIMGHMERGSIINSYSSATVTGDSYVGGILGSNCSTPGVVVTSSLSFTGSVSGNSNLANFTGGSACLGG